MRLCYVQCCPHYASLLSRHLENNFLEKDKERKSKKLGTTAVNVIWKILIKQKIREISLSILLKILVKTSYESRLPSRLYEDQLSCSFKKKNVLEGLYYSIL